MKKLLSLTLTGIVLLMSAEIIGAFWNGPPMGMRLMPAPPWVGPLIPAPPWAAPMPPASMWFIPTPRQYAPQIRLQNSAPQFEFKQLSTELETVKSVLDRHTLQLAEASQSEQVLSVVRDQLQAEIELLRTEATVQKETLKGVHAHVAKLTDALKESQ